MITCQVHYLNHKYQFNHIGNGGKNIHFMKGRIDLSRSSKKRHPTYLSFITRLLVTHHPSTYFYLTFELGQTRFETIHTLRLHNIPEFVYKLLCRCRSVSGTTIVVTIKSMWSERTESTTKGIFSDDFSNVLKKGR